MGYGCECYPHLQSARFCISSTTTSVEAREVVVSCPLMAAFVERNCVLMAGMIRQRNEIKIALLS
jgi:hypothetical protein